MRAAYAALFAASIASAIAMSPASADEASKPTRTIRSVDDLDRYLATTPPGESPLDRLSPPAKARLIAAFRRGTFRAGDIAAELTHDEALALMSLFGFEASLPRKLRDTHVSIGATETPSMSAAYERLLESNSTGAAAPTVAEYRRTFAPRQNAESLRAMSNGDVALMLDAALTTAQADASVGAAKDARLDLGELDRRHATAPAWPSQVFAVLLYARDYDAARAFRASYATANLPPVPVVRDETHGIGPTVVDASGPDGALVRRTMPIDGKARVIVVAGCHFSVDAVRDIEADPELRRVFAHDVTWIAPPADDPADPLLATWNREHPLAPISTAWSASEWRVVDTWLIPTFYFLRDGRVVSKVVSWQGHRDAVLDGFRTIGLVR